MNVPHIHPRATEFLTIVEGSNVHTGFITENSGPPQFNNTLNRFQGVVLPQGSIHFEHNDNCDPAVFIAAFSNEDPGLSNVAQNFFRLTPDIVDAVLPTVIDGTNVIKFSGSLAPEFIQGVQSCLDRCGIKPSG